MNTLHEAVAHWSRARPEATALAHDGGHLSYRALYELAGQAAAGFRAKGVRAGDVIAVQLPNVVPFVVTLLAAGALDARVQLLHMAYRRAELAALLRHGGASTYVGMARFKDEAPLATVASLGLMRLLVEVAAGEGGVTGHPAAGSTPWQALLQAEDCASFARIGAVSPDAGYVLLHTSGTTADPKGVPVSHRQFIGNAAASLAPLQVTAADVLLPAAPLSHLYGLFVLEMALLAGACVSLLPAFSPDALVQTMARDRVTAIFAGPAHFRPLLGRTDAGRREAVPTDAVPPDAVPPDAAPRGMTGDAWAGLRMICLSGTAVARDLAQAVEALMPHGKVIQLWGMSELQAGSYGRPEDPADIRLATAGRPSPGTEFRVVQADGHGNGRLQVRGRSLFDGYLDNPQATAAAFNDGWFDTGDTGYLTADGALVLTGRTKEIINRGGVKFNPIDVEGVIDRMPGVLRSAVVPMPDPVLGERACVFLQMAAGTAAATLDQVKEALERAGVARFKWPERLVSVDEIPLTPTQKIIRRRLVARLAGHGEQRPGQEDADSSATKEH